MGFGTGILFELCPSLLAAGISRGNAWVPRRHKSDKGWHAVLCASVTRLAIIDVIQSDVVRTQSTMKLRGGHQLVAGARRGGMWDTVAPAARPPPHPTTHGHTQTGPPARTQDIDTVNSLQTACQPTKMSKCCHWGSKRAATHRMQSQTRVMTMTQSVCKSISQSASQNIGRKKEGNRQHFS